MNNMECIFSKKRSPRSFISNSCVFLFLCLSLWYKYNENRGLIDKYDMQISFTKCIRRSEKWYKKFFFHLVDLTIYNAYVLYKLKKNINLRLAEYQLELIREIIGKYGSQVQTSIGRPRSEHPLRLTARHFPSRIASTVTQAKRKRKCYVCAHTVRREKSRRDTLYECIECDVGLCVTDCFKDYHTLKAFWIMYLVIFWKNKHEFEIINIFS